MEQLKAILKQNRIHITQQRLEVLRVLKELNTHVTADDVRHALQQREIHLTVATVYNILNTFEKNNLIMKISTAGEPVIYDVNTCEHAHICDCATRQVADYNDQELFQMVREYLAAHPIDGVEPQRIEINILGSFKQA